MPVLVLFLLLPLVEIGLFIAVGGQIGVLATLALIVLSALAGGSVLRGQRDRVQAIMQQRLRVQPGTFMAEGAFRTMAGMLLILPGFLTDALGLILLVPPVQRAIMRGIAARATIVTSGRVYRDADVVEGDYSVRTPGQQPVDPGHRIDDLRPGHRPAQGPGGPAGQSQD